MTTNNWGSAPAYTGATLDAVHEALGIPQFSGASGTDWFLPFNGLIIQGGKISTAAGTATFPFVTGFQQQVLGVFIQPHLNGTTSGVTGTTLEDFTVVHTGATHDNYWWAIGV